MMDDTPTQTSGDDQPKRQSFGQSLNWISYLAVVLFMLVSGAVFWSRMADNALVAADFAGYLGGGFLIAGLLSWGVYGLTRHHKIATNLTFALVLMLIAAGNFSRMAEKTHNQRVFDAFEQETAQRLSAQRELLERSIAGEDTGAEIEAEFQGNLDLFDEASEQMSGREAQFMAVGREIMAQLQAPIRRYNQTSARFSEAGGIDPATLTDRETIADRLVMLDQFEMANEGFAQAFAGLEADARARLEALGVPDRDINEFIRGLKHNSTPDLVAAIRQTDRDLAQHFRGILQVLGDAFGRWSIDGYGQLVFEDDMALERYNTHCDAMMAAVAEQERLQRELLARQRQ